LNLLLSNDDGILARGLEVLADVAPDREQSGSSHSLTLDRPLRVTRKSDGSIQVDGTPTDCVLLALGEILDQKPDFVFSGINHGPNMGEDVLYSGTVAAAMEGLSFGVPGIALSLAGDGVDLLDTHRPWLDRLVRSILSVSEFPTDTLLNINLPAIPGDDIKGIRVTTLGNRVYSDALLRTADPWGRPGFWIGGGQISWRGREDSDFGAIQSGFISVTPLHLDLTNYGLLEGVRSWRLGE
jgi:5'-nucleotidase